MGRSILAIQPFGVGARGEVEGRKEEEEGKNEAPRDYQGHSEEYCCAPAEGGRGTKEGTRNVSTFHNRLDCPNRSPTAFFLFSSSSFLDLP